MAKKKFTAAEVIEILSRNDGAADDKSGIV